MQWSDEAVVLSVRPHGETAAVAELLTREHGRHLGLVHGGRSRRQRPVLQPGNEVTARWTARISEQLGSLSVELTHARAAQALDSALALGGLQSLASLCGHLPERDPHPGLFEVTLFVLAFIGDDETWPALYARWELALLAELGLGLDLATCALTGATAGLAYVSPNSGRAVSDAAAAPYRDRLLPLPPFFLPGGGAPRSRDDLLAALALTGHFLATRLLAPAQKTLPAARTRLIAALSRGGR